jgi:tRNA 5-methylaminomethyl-2-thiouridine biosynthesis bifunctional protein
VLVIGAGLAGCASARALAELGAEVVLVDRHEEPAEEASGNPAALVHPVFHKPDTVHAQLHRTAALHAWRDIRSLARKRSVAFGQGLIQLRSDAAGSTHVDANEVLQDLGPDDVEPLSGLRLRRAAWLHKAAGWVNPRDLCRAWLLEAGEPLRFQGSTLIERIEPQADGRWQAQAMQGSAPVTLSGFDAVVVAAGGGTSRTLLSPHGDASRWPLKASRGQLMLVPGDAVPIRMPRCAVSGAGYAIPCHGPGGKAAVLIGATRADNLLDTRISEADDETLWQIAHELGVWVPAGMPPQPVLRRAAVRWAADDKLPLIGPLAAAGAGAHGRTDQARFVKRVAGLYVFTALGSRGVAWADLGARCLVASMLGLASPLASSLLDRVDAARFSVRAARRTSAR